MTLNEFRLFDGAPPEQLANLDAAMPGRRTPAGQLVYALGNDSNGMFLLESGSIRFERATRDGNRFVTGFCAAGGCFGELEMIADIRRDADAIAVTDCTYRCMPADVFHALFNDSAWFSRNLCGYVNNVRRMHASMYRSSVTLDLPGRIARWLINLDYFRDSDDAPMRVSQDDLAGVIGASRQSINRHLRQWEEDGAILLGYGEIRILHWPAIYAAAKLPAQPAKSVADAGDTP